ncbi:MAG: alkaline phosphatase family protein [Candidatus Omnitrophota bacterium]
MNKTKTFIIGLDGVSFRLIRRWISDNHLPTLKSLMEKGCYCDLESVYPPLTPAAWTSFYTGKNPGKHGLFDYQYRREGTYEMLPVDSGRVRSDSLWKILGTYGKKVGVINVPMTYPAQEVNGFMITGLFTPNLSDLDKTNFTYPEALKDEIRSNIGRYRIHPRYFYAKGNIDELVRDYCELIDQRVETTLYLMRSKPWDLLMMVINETDHIQHQLWHLLDPDHPDFDARESEKYRDLFLRVYRRIDEGIARMLEDIDTENTNIIIMSDHGLGPVYKWINLNTWLLKKGYIRIKKSLRSRLKYIAFLMGFTPANAYRMMLRLTKNKGKKGGKLATGKRFLERLFLNEEDIEWERTRAYSLSHMGQVNINLKGREPRGMVAPEDYGDMIRVLRDDLLKAGADNSTADKLIAGAFTKDKLFQGPYVDQAADLYLKVARDHYHILGGAAFISNKVIERSYGNSATHRIDGIFIACGPAVKSSGAITERIRIFDIAANILYMMKIPIPSDLDGKIIEGIYTAEYLNGNKAEYRNANPRKKAVSSGSAGLSEEEIAATREMLKKLGYVRE